MAVCCASRCDMPDFRDFAVKVEKPGATWPGTSRTLGNFLREVMRLNMNNFRVFGPDETQSNRLEAIYEVSKKVWLAEYFPEDADGGELAPDGRVMEMLSEHTLEGWLEGYLLTGRHGLFNTTRRSSTSSIRCSTSTPSGWRTATSCPGAPMWRRSIC